MTRHVNNRKHILETIHNWSAGCPYAHALWCRPFGVHLKVLQRLRTCQFLWGSGVLYYTSRQHQRTFKVLLLIIFELWAVVDPSLRSWSSSWRIGDRSLVRRNGFQDELHKIIIITNALQESRLCWKKPIVRPGKPPWFALFLPNAKDWAILTTFDETEFRSLKSTLSEGFEERVIRCF